MSLPYLIETTDDVMTISGPSGKWLMEFTTTPIASGYVIFTTLDSDTKVYYSKKAPGVKLLTYLKTLYPIVDVCSEHVICSPRTDSSANQKMHWLLAVGKTRFYSSNKHLRWQPPKSSRNVRVTTSVDGDILRIPALENQAFVALVPYSILQSDSKNTDV